MFLIRIEIANIPRSVALCELHSRLKGTVSAAVSMTQLHITGGTFDTNVSFEVDGISPYGLVVSRCVDERCFIYLKSFYNNKLEAVSRVTE